jgi:hypothetical protein
MLGESRESRESRLDNLFVHPRCILLKELVLSSMPDPDKILVTFYCNRHLGRAMFNYSGTGLYKLSVEPPRTPFPGTGDEGKGERELPGLGEGQADDVAEPAALRFSCKSEGESVREGRVEFGCC